MLQLLGLLCITTSCASAPTSYRESDLASPETRKLAAPLYWQRLDLPSLGASRQAKIAIADFTVEFVTTSLEANASTVPAGEKEKPEAVAARIGTLAPKQILHSPESLQGIANALYDTFTDDLTRRGHQVLPVAAVLSSKAYGHLRTIGTTPQKVTVEQSGRNDPDIGYATHLTVVPAKGLSIAKGTTGISPTDLAIAALQETGSDAVLRVCIRVSVFRGCASLDRRTQIWVTRPQGRGTLSLQKQLVSETNVLAGDTFQGLRPNEYRINPSTYQAATQRLLTTALALAADAGLAPESGK